MRRRGDGGDLFWIVVAVLLGMALLATLDADAQDLDSGLSEGYMAWWDSPEGGPPLPVGGWLRGRTPPCHRWEGV